jgi:4-aminobutyrate aminotransferase
MTNIDILTENDYALVKRAAVLGEEIKDRLKAGAGDTRVIGDVRGRGLMIGIEMVEDKETREPLHQDSVFQIVMGMLNRGLIMVPCGRYGNVFRFMPPLVLTREHAAKAADILLETARTV